MPEEQPTSDHNPSPPSPAKKPAEYVSELKSMELQIGEHVLTALQHGDAMAVLSAVVVGPDGVQRIVSAPLDAERMQMVQEILQSAKEEETQRVSCFGFHCKSPALDQSTGEPPEVRDDH